MQVFVIPAACRELAAEIPQCAGDLRLCYVDSLKSYATLAVRHNQCAIALTEIEKEN